MYGINGHCLLYQLVVSYGISNKHFIVPSFNQTIMVMNKIPEGYDLREILEALLDALSYDREINLMEVQRIIEKGKPE
jgi:hypothetical protein